MTEQELKRCPLGIQTFENIIEGNYLYIDKTAYIYDMVNRVSKYCFLSRPRRFGKSLLTSTMRSYFEGRKDLFKGLALEKLEKDWIEHPVLHFDMSGAKNKSKEIVESMLDRQLNSYEEIYGIGESHYTHNDRLNILIKTACQKTGEKVVVLIDEYDAPLLDVMHENENLPVLRDIMRNFYSPLKECDPYLHFVFFTGITKFSQLSIFSELNNIKNISMDEPFAAVCGITEEEMLTQMKGYILRLAEKKGISYEEAVQRLKNHYDGYHFTWPSPDIYNPYSLLNAFVDNEIRPYWFGSGTPTYLIEMLKKYEVSPSVLGGRIEVEAAEFDAPTERITNIIPLLYQSGYYTIKDYDEFGQLYTLTIPNTEIKVGLMKSLFPHYVNSHDVSVSVVGKMYRCIHFNDIAGALELLKTFFQTIPYCDNTDYEGHYQQLFYVIFSLFGAYVNVEVRTHRGRVDMVMLTADKLYLFELKLNKSAEAALNQIDLKNYPERFALSGLPVVKVGINFNSEKGTIEDWVIE